MITVLVPESLVRSIMEYTVLARRFRPQSFGDVVGQENIAQALRNAIASNRVAHAYLFTGARGVGKTSTARILAKSLNCPESAGGDPCNRCDVCQNIAAGSDVDVIEIDGASNRGIDEIRTLRANVNVKPMRSRYKIYIIDEVHMLTKEAFNALLKTLEEPPANVKFIFCTTDPQKVPDTILSRCQRFDFGTIATATIGQRLAEIASIEGVEVDPKAVQLVARRAAGSMRDSQSLFDQLLAFGGKTIGAADVHRLLGTAPDERLVDLGQALVGREPARVLELLETALQSGVQISELADQLLAFFRDLMVLACGAGETPFLSVSDDQRSRLARQAASAGLQTVLAALQILAEAKQRMKGTTYSRVLLELALIRIATLDQLDDLTELVARLRQGPGGLGGPVPQAARGTAASGSMKSVSLGGAAPSSIGRKEVIGGRSSSSQPLSDRKSDRAPLPPENSQIPPKTGDLSREIRQSQGESEGGVAPSVAISFEPGRENDILAQTLLLLTDMAKSNAKNVSSAAISGPNSLVLTFPKGYHFNKQFFDRSPEQFSRVEKAVERVVGRPIRVSLAVDESNSSTQETCSQESPTDQQSKPQPAADDPQSAEQDSLVQRALTVLDAKLVKTETIVVAAHE
jgi:DNA polymerase-3 subunit gamma/tau